MKLKQKNNLEKDKYFYTCTFIPTAVVKLNHVGMQHFEPMLAVRRRKKVDDAIHIEGPKCIFCRNELV